MSVSTFDFTLPLYCTTYTNYAIFSHSCFLKVLMEKMIFTVLRFLGEVLHNLEVVNVTIER